MLKVGVTGGIGSGKTMVCRVFEVLGVPVFYADEAAKALMHSDDELRRGMISFFGSDSYDRGGQLNRKYIASRVFGDERELQMLNSLVHPAVFRDFERWADRKTGAAYVVKEAALLFESGSSELCDINVLVTSPEAVKIERIMSRDKISEEEVRARMSRQMPDAEKEKLADIIISNNEAELLVPQILQLHERFMSQGDQA